MILSISDKLRSIHPVLSSGDDINEHVVVNFNCLTIINDFILNELARLIEKTILNSKLKDEDGRKHTVDNSHYLGTLQDYIQPDGDDKHTKVNSQPLLTFEDSVHLVSGAYIGDIDSELKDLIDKIYRPINIRISEKLKELGHKGIYKYRKENIKDIIGYKSLRYNSFDMIENTIIKIEEFFRKMDKLNEKNIVISNDEKLTYFINLFEDEDLRRLNERRISASNRLYLKKAIHDDWFSDFGLGYPLTAEFKYKNDSIDFFDEYVLYYVKKIIESNETVKICKGCKKPFIPKRGAKYCNYSFEEGKVTSCSKHYAKKNYEEKKSKMAESN